MESRSRAPGRWGGGGLTRIPRARARGRSRAAREFAFPAAPGWRPAAGGLAALIALMLLVHQLFVEGPKPLLRALVLLAAAGFGAINMSNSPNILTTAGFIFIAPLVGFVVAFTISLWFLYSVR